MRGAVCDRAEPGSGRVRGPAVLALVLLTGCASGPQDGAVWLGLSSDLSGADDAAQAGAEDARGKARRIPFDLLAELGAPLGRDPLMNWARVQPSPGGACDFSVTDDVVRRAQAAGIDLLPVCRGVPAWAAGQLGPSAIHLGLPARQHAGAFTAFVQRFVERYDGDAGGDMPGLRRPLRAYEFMGQMDGVPPAEYAYWLKLFHAAVKAADHRALVVLGGLTSPGIRTFDRPWGDYHVYFERLLDEPELKGPAYPYFDVVSFHNYPLDYPGRGAFSDALAYLNRTLAARKLTLPIWLTEYGCGGGVNQEAHWPAQVVQWALRARALGAQRVYLQGLWDGQGPDRTGGRRDLGLVRLTEGGDRPTKSPAFRALAVLLKELKERPVVSQRGEGMYSLSGKGKTTYVIWKEETYDPSPVLIPGWWLVRTLTGTAGPRQGADINLNSSPLFLQRTTSPFIN